MANETLKVPDALVPLIKAAVEKGDKEGEDDAFKRIEKAVADKAVTAEKAEAIRAALRLLKAAKVTEAESSDVLIDAGLAKKAEPPPPAPPPKDPPLPGGFIVKADGKDLDFEAMKTPEDQQPFLRAMWQEMELSKARAKKAEEIAAKVQKDRETEVIRARVEKTAHVGAHDDLTKTLGAITDDALREQVFVALEKADAAADSAGATRSIGSDVAGDGGKSAADELDKIAAKKAAESGGKLTKAQAYVEYIETEEGRKLYKQHLDEQQAQARS